MDLPKKECIHISQVLKQTKESLLKKRALELKDLSNQTIHDICNFQDEATITIAVLLYTLSKIVERDYYKKIKSWTSFVKKFNAVLDLAIQALNKNDQDSFAYQIQNARKILEAQSVNIQPYIEDVLKKASINKGSKIHEHGISIEKTSKLLGVSQWELLSYVGQRAHEVQHYKTISTKSRVKMAMEFFS